MNEKYTYPAAHRGDVVDTFHGTKVPDPYRWLEDPQAPETRAFIDAQNALTESLSLPRAGACLRPPPADNALGLREV